MRFVLHIWNMNSIYIVIIVELLMNLKDDFDKIRALHFY